MADQEKNTDGFSFESILAEVKGSAFIDGDKRTPPDLLEEKADRILREAAEMSPPATQQEPAEKTLQIDTMQHEESTHQEMLPTDSEPDFSDTVELPVLTLSEDETYTERSAVPPTSFSAAMDAAEEDALESEHAVQPNELDEINKRATRLFDHYSAQADDAISQETQEQANRVTLFDFDRETMPSEERFDDYSYEEEGTYIEPDLRTVAGKFAKACNSISLRCIPASIITLIMVMITFTYEAHMVVPFGIGYSLELATGVLIVCLLIVMMLCVDVIIRGVDFLIRGEPNAETLILFSCVFSLLSSVFAMLSGSAVLLPFNAVSALSLVFATFGERFNLRAMTETLKTAVGSSEPYGVQAEYNSRIDKSVLKKTYNRTDGFYSNLIQPDITEQLYRYAAPALLIAALLLTLIIIIANGGVENSLHILSALLAAAAPFSALLSFSLPFGSVAKAARKSGAALAGWGGADDICFTDGVCVTDDDLFPPGTLKLSGVKVYDGAVPDKAMRYTASLIIASGSGLTSLFSEILKQQGEGMMKVEGFECHESGIAAVIQGDKISTGSAAFMNLLGVRVPDDTSLKNAVYTAVNNRLVAMFAIEYKPLPSVQSALISMLKWRIDLFFAMRDFNVTPSMVGQRFKVPFESFVFIPAKDSYSISDPYSGKQGRMASILVREGLGPFADVITSGRLLRSASLFATILSIVSAALGVLFVFIICWSGSFVSASPGNLLIFMLCMLATVLIVCGYVRLRK
jgi:hypothetical protein